ncbi:MAG: molybdate ABC transporter permease subunit [Limisphaerales bacterium]
MTAAEWQIVAFTLEMAVLSTALILPPGLALAWCLARRHWRGKALVETVVALPLVLPPVVTGLILLKLLGRRGLIGHWLFSQFHFDVVFTWRAVALALAVTSFPLLVWTARAAIGGVNPALEQIARTLGAGEWRVFFTITLPLAKRGLLAGTLLAFARALGEFGATIMVAGNIPGLTTTLSTDIYQLVQLGENSHAWMLAGISVALAFVAVWINIRLMRRPKD